MPRNGSGVYSKPAGTTAVANAIIESAKYNSTIDDLVADANLARPIVAGGTAGTTPVAGGDNLSTKGADIASAATTDIGAATGRYVHITGTTTITSLGTKTAGVVRILTFDGALTLTHNATSLILPAGANIQTAAGDVAVMVSEGGGNWRCVSYSRASGDPTSTQLARGKLFGLTLANNGSDATNDIDIAAGSAASDTSPYYLMTLAAGVTKRLDANWAVGTNQGGLDTGAPANTTYFVWLIQRSDTGVVDVLFSASPTSPTMPTNYDRKRRIGSIIRESAAIVAFKQYPNGVFKRAPVVSLNSTSAVASTLVSLAVPVGIVVQPILNSFLQIPAASSAQNLIGDAAVGSANTTIHTLISNQATVEINAERVTITGGFYTDISANIYFARVISSGSITTNTMTVLGWIDDRGQNV